MNKKFPKYLSTPVQILWWESDDFLIFLLFVALGLIFHGWFWLMAFVFPYLYSKVKKKYHRGFLKHLFYFVGFLDFKGYPHFFHDRFYE